MQQLNIIKLKDVLSFHPVSKSTFFKQRDAGLLPPAIKLGAQSVGYIKSEIEAILTARTQGASDMQLKELVIKLVTKRGSFSL